MAQDKDYWNDPHQLLALRKRLSRRRVLQLGGASALAAAFWGCADGEEAGQRAARDLPDVFQGLSGSMVLWNQGGGDTLEAITDVYGNSFTEATGVDFVSDFFCCGISKLEAQVEAGNVQWDVLELIADAEFLLAKDKGLLEKLDLSQLPTDQLEDFGVDEYGVQAGIPGNAGINLAWRTDVWPLNGKHPEHVADIFNTKDFPGKRGFFGFPQYGGTLEVALLADGVPLDDLYPLDVDRALDKLDTIKDDIVFWENATEGIQILVDRQVDLGMTYNGRVYARVIDEGAPLALTWNGAIILTTWNSIAKDAPNYDNGLAFLAWVLQPEIQAKFVERIPYPAPIKGLFELLPDRVKSWAPIGPNLENARFEDGQYYLENFDEILEKFNAWKAG